jgi:hypothetical protein
MSELQKNLQDRPRRFQAELQSDSKTLHYDLDQLIGLAQRFESPDIQSDRIRSNAFIESFAVRCRALILFLFGHWKKVIVNGETVGFSLRENDILAFDYHRGWDQDCPKFTEVMARAKYQADKHVAHVTIERRDLNQPGSSKESIWDLREATSAVCSALAYFITKAPPGNFDATVLREMKDLIDRWTALTNVQTALLVELPDRPSPTRCPGLVSAVGSTSAPSPHGSEYMHVDDVSDGPRILNQSW